jgi:hypothetical protein
MAIALVVEEVGESLTPGHMCRILGERFSIGLAEERYW